MAVPLLAVDSKEFSSQSLRLESLLISISVLPPNHRKLVAEIALVRLFLLVQNTIRSISAKILCGASYCDSSEPKCLVRSRTIRGAYDLMRSHSRSTPKKRLSWGESSEIRDNLELTLSETDPFFVTVMNHGTLLVDMRYIRNHIVHYNDTTLSHFRKMVRKHYGGLKQGITPGLLLLTTKLGTKPLLQQYLIESRVLIKSLVRG